MSKPKIEDSNAAEPEREPEKVVPIVKPSAFSLDKFRTKATRRRRTSGSC